MQEEDTLKEEKRNKIKVIGRHQHEEEVRQQIREKEEQRALDRKAFFEEGIKLDMEAKARYIWFPEKLTNIVDA